MSSKVHPFPPRSLKKSESLKAFKNATNKLMMKKKQAKKKFDTIAHNVKRLPSMHGGHCNRERLDPKNFKVWLTGAQRQGSSGNTNVWSKPRLEEANLFRKNNMYTSTDKQLIQHHEEEFVKLGFGVVSYFQILRGFIKLFLCLTLISAPLLVICASSNRIHKTDVFNLGQLR